MNLPNLRLHKMIIFIILMCSFFIASCGSKNSDNVGGGTELSYNVDFTATTVAGNPKEFKFTSTHTPVGGVITSYDWLIDGTTYNEAEPTHSFATLKTFDVSLDVTFEDGSTVSKNKTILPDFIYNPAVEFYNKDIVFTVPTKAAEMNYVWLIDGVEATPTNIDGDNVTLSFSNAGEYELTLKLQNEETLIASTSQKVYVSTFKEIFNSGNSISSFGLTPDGFVYAWGSNDEGQLGLGDSGAGTERATPELVAALSGIGVTSIGVSTHVLALTRDGEVYAWGSNTDGQLGLGDNGTGTTRTTPELVTSLSGKGVTSVTAGSLYSLALTRDGEVYAWGANPAGQLGLGNSSGDYIRDTPELVTFFSGKSVTSIVAGSMHSLALTRDGEVYAWGMNVAGQLGLGSAGGKDDFRDTPELVTSLSGIGVKTIGVGYLHSFAITSDSEVYTWGMNENGELGLGSAGGKGDFRATPELVTSLSGIGVTSVVAGGMHNLATTSGGEVYAWGMNIFGQLGLGDSATGTDKATPELVTSLSGKGVNSVIAGSMYNFATTSGGEVYAWGMNTAGQLGLGNSGAGTDKNIPTLTKIFAITP